MKEKHRLAGKTVVLNLKDKEIDSDQLDGKEFVVEDWCENVMGGSWMFQDGNPACLKYAMRAGFSGLPTDNNVLYGKVGSSGHLIHESEIKEQPNE